MTFPFSLTAAAFSFFAGTAVAAIVYFVLCLILKKSIKGIKITLFIASLAMLTGVFACYLVFFRETDFGQLKSADWIFAASILTAGILFLVFTRWFVLIAVPAYLIFSFLAYLSLNSLYPRKSFFDYKAETEQNRMVVIECHEVNPYLLLPMPRIWYKIKTDESISVNPLYSFMNRTLFTDTHDVELEIPRQKYYPVQYKLNIKCSATNLEVKAESVN